ncbi:MAG TPA: vWA domain-containing protein, partial [Gemmataceae bacterium]|nr:vWA domain-containing protein [Gemmataceae bacterium]
MTRRLKVVGGFLALVAIITTSHLWGDPAKPVHGKRLGRAHNHAPDLADEGFTDDLAESKFAKGGMVTYRTSAGDSLFALQIKPKLEAAPDRPRDYAIVVDTSASQARGPLANARLLSEEVIKEARDQDRIALWTINTPAATANLVVRGFQPPRSKEVAEAVENLKKEVPLGDTDLKGGLTKIITSFDNSGDRQQIVLFLGDGMSVHNPITNADRSRLCEQMVKHNVVFFPVPLGAQLDPKNLHGIATGTGGTVVRVLAKDKPADTAKRLNEAIAAPVLYPKEFKFSAEVVEFFPTVLPPLRADAATLVVGKFKGGDKLSYTIEGATAGKDMRLDVDEPVAAAEADNFFLISMLEQWKNAKDQPALTRADRALASYSQQTQLARNNLIADAEWALSEDKLEAAQSLFEKAKRIDPEDKEAAAGLKIVEKIRGGVINKKQLKDQLAQAEKDGIHNKLAQAGEQVPPPPRDVAPPVEQENLLQQQRARMQVEQQRVTGMVEDAQREARRLLSTDPDAAHELLKRTYAAIRDNPDINDATRLLLSNRLETALRSVDTQGVRIKSQLAQQLRAEADARRRFDMEQANIAESERIKR